METKGFCGGKRFFLLLVMGLLLLLNAVNDGIANINASEDTSSDTSGILEISSYSERKETIDENEKILTITNVSGYISFDTTWTAANSPYVATGNVVVSSGVTLTIEPGVTVKFDVGKSLQIDGKLIAKGSSSERITFTKNGSDNWGYILFNDSSTDASFDSSGSYTSGSTLEYCIVEYAGGTSVSDNGAVRMNNAHPFINYCTINNNSASGIYGWNLSSTLKITNSTITNNTSSSHGAGIRCSGGTKIISDNTISNNTATSSSSIYGGGVYCKDGTNTISGNTISNNTVSNYGGGIMCYGGTNTISSNTITNNTAKDDGGGIHSYQATSTISNNTITGNTASDNGGTYAGGGIMCNESTTTVSNNTISNNTALGYGGGINCYRGTNTIKNNMIMNNSSNDYGGGIMCGDRGTHTISNNIITGNTASDSGGGIYCGGGTFTISQNHVARNSASKASGIRYYSSSEGKEFNYNLFTGNNATGTSSTYTVSVSSKPLFNYNNLASNTATYELWNDNAYGSSNLDAKNNWWGVTDDSTVQGKIYDWIDDSTKGTVNYYPYGTSTNTAAPMSPPASLTITESSDQITVNWSANSESDLAGYIVYWDTDSGHSYTNSANVGNVTNHTITGLSLTTGRYYVTVTAYDTNYSSSNDLSDTITNENQTDGYESCYAVEKVAGDITAPAGGALNINGGAVYTKSATVTVSLSATDSIGVTGYYISTSSSTPSASASGWTTVTSTTSYSESVSYTLSGGDGSKTIYVWFKDSGGNISSSASDSITLDTTVPIVTITSPTSSDTYTATSSPLNLSGSTSDSTSGISGVTWSNSLGGTGTASGTTSWSISSIALSGGDNVITVTAKDGAGNSGTDTITVTYSSVTVLTPTPTVTSTPTPSPTPSSTIEWYTSTIDSAGNVGDYSSITVDSNNKVHISYRDISNQDLKYATNKSGSWITSTVDSSGTTGWDTSIATDSNNAVHISYKSESGGDLKYATDASGSWNILTIDSNGWDGAFSSIAIDSNGKVHIAYYDQSSNKLEYATNVSDSWAITAIDSVGDGWDGTCSLVIDSNNNMHISYFEQDNRDLKYANNISGSWNVSTVDSIGDTGYSNAIAIDRNGKLHIAYRDATNNRLKYATNTLGSWSSYTIDSSGNGYNKHIALDSGGKVHICYSDTINQYLKYATNSSGSWTTSIIDSSGNVGTQPSIAIDSMNNLHISYYDTSNGNLKYANAKINTIASPTPAASPTPQVSPTPAGEGIVFGIVNDQDELPLKGVTITITGENSSDSTETDEYGFYEFGGLAKGEYTLTYEKEGFLDQTLDISLNEGEVKGVDTVTMERVETGKIYGYVVNIKGSPIEFVRLRLKGIKTKVIKTASSDADGFFEFTDLDADTYVIFAKKKGYRKNQQKVKLGEGESTEIEIEMKKTSKRIKGLLLEEEVQ